MKTEKLRFATVAKPYLITGALLAGLSVVLGAFGAHGLKSVLTAQQLNTFEIGVRSSSTRLKLACVIKCITH